ncbi:uncharacterized protein PODANS_3_2240, partial [Podospora anserina S mat+]
KLGGGSFLLFSLYVLVRVFIVVESFINLRAEPIGVFSSPPWLQNFPHV